MNDKTPQELLTIGVSYLGSNELSKATESFSSALDQTITDKSLLHSLYTCRSTSNYLQGNDCNAFYDANKAIEVDPTGYEGYLRRSNVYLIYSFFSEALQDMKKAQELNKDPRFAQDLSSRISFMEKVQQKSTSTNLPNRQNFLSATLPETLTLSDAQNYGKFIFDQKNIEKASIQSFLRKLRGIIETESKSFENGIGRLTGPKITVLGRIDGEVGKLYAFFDKNGYPSEENVYLINGNFIGRNDHRVLLILFLFKVACPTSIYFTKGLFDTNGHQIENSTLNSPNYIMNPLKIIESLFGQDASNEVVQILSMLPICYIVNEKIAVTSSGPQIDGTFSLWCQLSSDGKTSKIDGYPIFAYGNEQVDRFLSEKGIEKIVCSNKVLSEGKEILMDGKFLNVSFGKTDHHVFGYKLGYALICGDQVEACVENFDFFPLTVHYNENNPYYEGIFFNMRKYTDVNPALAGFFAIKGISEDLVPVTETIDTSIYQFSYMTIPVPDPWIIVDFRSRKVEIENYMIESAPLNKGNDHMKSWRIDGSDDLQNWSEIDVRENVDELNGPMCNMVFKVTEEKRKFFRFIKLQQIGKNHRGNLNLCLGHFDFFGTVQ